MLRPDSSPKRPTNLSLNGKVLDMARELGAYLAPRRVRYYPSRGTGYESHLAPPPHLVGLRIAALDAELLAEVYVELIGARQATLILVENGDDLVRTPQQIADDIKCYEELGVRHLMVNLQDETQARTLERMQHFADRIMPLTA